MLTPEFSLTQDEWHVYVTIRAPYVKVSEVDWLVEGNLFQFHVAPYFLRLTFDGELIEDERAKAQYDIDKSEFVVTLPKVEAGMFPNLDMQTLLMSRRQKQQHERRQQRQQGEPDQAGDADSSRMTHARPGIQVLSSEEFGEEPLPEGEEENEDDLEDDYDWEVEQTLHEEPLFGPQGFPYGFDLKYSGTLSKLQQELPDITMLADPDNTSPSQRRSLRILHEDESFSLDHYLGDFAEQESIQHLVEYQTRWRRYLDSLGESRDILQQQWLLHTGIESQEPSQAGTVDQRRDVPFREKELEAMRQLRRVEVLATSVPRALLSVLDIVCAFLYENRVTEGEFTVESGWTIRTLSSTFAFLDEFRSAADVLNAFTTRSLVYPLYRTWALTQAVLQDVCDVLLLGKSALLQCLLGTRWLLARDDVRYVLNELYVDDLCVWLQGLPTAVLDSFALHVHGLTVRKEQIRFPLASIERLLSAEDDEEDEDEDDEDEEEDDDEDEEEDDDGDEEEEEEDSDKEDDSEGEEETREVREHREHEDQTADGQQVAASDGRRAGEAMDNTTLDLGHNLLMPQQQRAPLITVISSTTTIDDDVPSDHSTSMQTD
eukprot:m.195463 g.195463  ORF g.195463 m.195463 type:complete len:602 (-) comp16803_c0_seq1:301-2106(-)